MILTYKNIMLPKELRPKGLFNLIRLGRDNDGGYLICKNSVENSNCLISFGIKDDFSFEERFKAMNNSKIHAYDPTVTYKTFLKQIIRSLMGFNLNSFFINILNYFKFKKFFDNKENFFFRKKIGKGGNIIYPYISIDDVIKLANNEKNSKFFFKIDIEGSEYSILDDLVKYSDIISGAAIEFHQCDLHMERIVKFLKNFNLILVHTHPNNWEVNGINNVPSVLELTFSSNPELISNDVSFPHQLDQKNNPNVEDVELIFSDNKFFYLTI